MASLTRNLSLYQLGSNVSRADWTNMAPIKQTQKVFCHTTATGCIHPREIVRKVSRAVVLHDMCAHFYIILNIQKFFYDFGWWINPQTLLLAQQRALRAILHQYRSASNVNRLTCCNTTVRAEQEHGLNRGRTEHSPHLQSVSWSAGHHF